MTSVRINSNEISVQNKCYIYLLNQFQATDRSLRDRSPSLVPPSVTIPPSIDRHYFLFTGTLLMINFNSNKRFVLADMLEVGVQEEYNRRQTKGRPKRLHQPIHITYFCFLGITP